MIVPVTAARTPTYSYLSFPTSPSPGPSLLPRVGSFLNPTHIVSWGMLCSPGLVSFESKHYVRFLSIAPTPGINKCSMYVSQMSRGWLAKNKENVNAFFISLTGEDSESSSEGVFILPGAEVLLGAHWKLFGCIKRNMSWLSWWKSQAPKPLVADEGSSVHLVYDSPFMGIPFISLLYATYVPVGNVLPSR